MVFSGTVDDVAQSGQTSSDSTTDGSGPIETAERIATLQQPFALLISVLVQALTAYTLLQKV